MIYNFLFTRDIVVQTAFLCSGPVEDHSFIIYIQPRTLARWINQLDLNDKYELNSAKVDRSMIDSCSLTWRGLTGDSVYYLYIQ